MHKLGLDDVTIFALYFSVFLFFLVAYNRTKKLSYLINLGINLIYIGIFTFWLTNEENFRYGGSLAVYLYALFFVIAHIAIFIVAHFVKKLYLALTSPQPML